MIKVIVFNVSMINVITINVIMIKVHQDIWDQGKLAAASSCGFTFLSTLCQCIAHCTLYIAHCTLHTAHCTLHTAHCTLHTLHCSRSSVQGRARAHLPAAVCGLLLNPVWRQSTHCTMGNPKCNTHCTICNCHKIIATTDCNFLSWRFSLFPCVCVRAYVCVSYILKGGFRGCKTPAVPMFS